MINALDQIAVAGSAEVYETLLGRRSQDGSVQTGNVAIAFSADGGPVSSMTFATGDLGKAARLLERRGVPATKGETLELSNAATHGVAIALVERHGKPAPSPATVDDASAIAELDHVVIRTPNPERAVAFYAGRLGLDLRLDRSNPEWGSRLLFFRCGDLVIEVAHDLKKGVSDGPDHLWGLSWRAADIAKANARLKSAGVDVSPVRTGRRPGTEVFSVNSHTEGVPTIVIGGVEHWGCGRRSSCSFCLSPGAPPPPPASSWKPEAPPPTASAKVSMVLLAVGEWARFGRQVVVYSTDQPPRTEQQGLREREAAERIHDYWASVDRPDRSGLDNVAWSAAFVSWDIASAGVPRDLFCPDQRHTIYVERMVDRARRPGAAFVAHRPSDRAPQVGDLICASRAGSGTTLENLNRGAGHCDIVVEVKPGWAAAIGGNVADSVSRSVFPLDGNGFLSPISARPVFAVIENRLP